MEVFEALEKAVAAQRSNVVAAEANVAALNEMQSYRVVKAPFDGVVTLRNVDVGTLVNAGNTASLGLAWLVGEDFFPDVVIDQGVHFAGRDHVPYFAFV